MSRTAASVKSHPTTPTGRPRHGVGGAWINKAALRRIVDHPVVPRMTPAQRAVWGVLVSMSDEDGVSWPSVRTIAHRTELSSRSVQRAVRDLSGMTHQHTGRPILCVSLQNGGRLTTRDQWRTNLHVVHVPCQPGCDVKGHVMQRRPDGAPGQTPTQREFVVGVMTCGSVTPRGDTVTPEQNRVKLFTSPPSVVKDPPASENFDGPDSTGVPPHGGEGGLPAPEPEHPTEPPSSPATRPTARPRHRGRPTRGAAHQQPARRKNTPYREPVPHKPLPDPGDIDIDALLAALTWQIPEITTHDDTTPAPVKPGWVCRPPTPGGVGDGEPGRGYGVPGSPPPPHPHSEETIMDSTRHARSRPRPTVDRSGSGDPLPLDLGDFQIPTPLPNPDPDPDPVVSEVTVGRVVAVVGPTGVMTAAAANRRRLTAGDLVAAWIAGHRRSLARRGLPVVDPPSALIKRVAGGCKALAKDLPEAWTDSDPATLDTWRNMWRIVSDAGENGRWDVVGHTVTITAPRRVSERRNHFAELLMDDFTDTLPALEE